MKYTVCVTINYDETEWIKDDIKEMIKDSVKCMNHIPGIYIAAVQGAI